MHLAFFSSSRHILTDLNLKMITKSNGEILQFFNNPMVFFSFINLLQNFLQKW